MKRVICLLLCLVLMLGLLPAAATAADYEEHLVKLPVTLENGTAVYLGVGEWHNGKWYVMTSGSTSEDTNFVLSACLWRKTTNNGEADYTVLGASEAEEVFAQLSEVRLSIEPASGNENPNVPTPVYLATEAPEFLPEAVSSGMQQVARYTLEEEYEGCWVFTASCKVNGTTYSASGTITRKVVETITIGGENVKDVEAVNKALEEAFDALDESREYSVCVKLNPEEYSGQIIIPESTKDVSVTIEGQTKREDHTILEGGISSENVYTIVNTVHFKGAGTNKETWPIDADDPNSGAENSAFYGAAGGATLNCIFENYDYAIKCTNGLRACGYQNVFVNNHIAWYLDHQEKSGGNPTAESCYFKDNDIAVYAKTFSMKPSAYSLSSSIFVNNGTDIENGTGHYWFVPGNFFVHISRPSLSRAAQEESFLPILEDDDDSQTCPYPMAAGSGVGQEEYEIEGNLFEWNQIDEENGDTISNTLASIYPIPEDYLAGMTFHVADPDTEEVLVTMEFEPEADEPAVAAYAAGIAMFALNDEQNEQETEQEEAAKFDASVTLDRSDASKLVFKMNDPCGKTVMLKIPCTFTTGVVLHGGEVIEGAVFNGESVSFQTSEGGEYVIIGSGMDAMLGAMTSLLSAGTLYALSQSAGAGALPATRAAR